MNNSFGSRLKEERIRLSLSQPELADIGGVKKNAQSNYERDERKPDADYLSKVQSAGIDTHYVLTGRRLTEAGRGDKPILYQTGSDALQPILNVQAKLGISFSAEELENTLGYAFTAQASEQELEQFLRSVYGFMGRPLPKQDETESGNNA